MLRLYQEYGTMILVSACAPKYEHNCLLGYFWTFWDTILHCGHNDIYKLHVSFPECVSGLAISGLSKSVTN